MVPHAIHAQQQNALKMNGVFVKLDAKDFLKLINENDDLLIVISETGIFTNQYQYLTSYKGFIFHCKSKEQLPLPSKHEKIWSQSVSLPVM
jgi:hypothetical protein